MDRDIQYRPLGRVMLHLGIFATKFTRHHNPPSQPEAVPNIKMINAT